MIKLIQSWFPSRGLHLCIRVELYAGIRPQTAIRDCLKLAQQLDIAIGFHHTHLGANFIVSPDETLEEAWDQYRSFWEYEHKQSFPDKEFNLYE